jgi:uncharacterized FlaG/YvyC family protein
MPTLQFVAYPIGNRCKFDLSCEIGATLIKIGDRSTNKSDRQSNE